MPRSILKLIQIAVLLGVALFCAFASYKAVSNQITETTVLTENRVSLARYLDGTVVRPFAYRVLTPVLIRAVEAAVNFPALYRVLPAAVEQKALTFCARATSVPTPSCDSVIAFAAVSCVYFSVFLVLMFFLARAVFPESPGLPVVAVVLAFFVVNSIVFYRRTHLYDYGTLMFAAALLLCLRNKWDIGFCVVLGFACLNKESLILYTVSFFFCSLPRLRLTKILTYVGIQIASFAVIYGIVRQRFRDNDGNGIEIWIWQQITFFTERMGLLEILILSISLLIVFYKFRYKDPFLQAASLIMVPFVPLILAGTFPGELRNLFEIIPLLVLLACDSVERLIAGDHGSVRPIMLWPRFQQRTLSQR